MNPSSIIRYFRDCYDADNRRGTVWNVFHRDVGHRIVLDGDEDLLSGAFPQVSVDGDAGRAAAKAAYLARKEKELLYCSLIVVGEISGEEGEPSQKLCAPLLMHPARIEEGEDGYSYLKPEWEERRINHRLLTAINDDEGAVDRVVDLLRTTHLTATDIIELITALENLDPRLDTTALYHYPKLISEKDLRGMMPSDGEGDRSTLKVVPAALVALFKKSVETRGVLNELSRIAEQGVLSAPMRALLAGEVQTGGRNSVSTRYVPAVLSNAQGCILDSAAVNPLTLVIGPPGTGKSFTIACLAIEHMSRGQSVLIASKMNHAVDVVGNKIEGQLGIEGCVVRAGRKQYLKELKKGLQEMMSGMNSATPLSRKEVTRLKEEVHDLDRSIIRLERELSRRCEKEMEWGPLLATGEKGFLERIRARYVQWKVEREAPLWQTTDRLERLLERRVETVARLVQSFKKARTDEVLRKHRPQLNSFLGAIRARSGSRQEELFGTIDFSILFKALPVWLVNLSDIHDLLPLGSEMFDLAIIDEATQCDIASCLPILQRAKRVVITGDPNQLRHLSFLAGKQQATLLEKHGLRPEEESDYNYREKSILDFMSERIKSQQQVIFLNEHYRSVPSIIGFSNENFYGGGLAIMTERPGERGEGVVINECEGEQSETGENAREAQFVVEAILGAIKVEESVDPERVRTIGVLSPFRRQADYIAERLAEALPIDAFERHEIMIGTSYTFQGEERDVMHLSMVVDDDSHSARFRFIDRPDAFNVAVTRARQLQHLYCSVRGKRLDGDSLLGRYIRYVNGAGDSTVSRGKSGTRSPDPFAMEVSKVLEEKGFTVWPGYRIAGGTLDLIVERDGVLCGIDLVGYPAGAGEMPTLERYRMLHRCGLRVVLFPYSQWVIHREESLKGIDLVSSGDSLSPTKGSGAVV